MQKDKRYKILNIVFYLVAGLMIAGALAFFIAATVKNNSSLFIGSCVFCGMEIVLTATYVIVVRVVWRK